jgi:hypothetical protein
MATAAKPDAILAWSRKLVTHKFDGSQYRLHPVRPPIGREIIELIVRMDRENSGWGIRSHRQCPRESRLSSLRSKPWVISHAALVYFR